MRLRPVADVPAERIDFSSVIRLEAKSTHRGAMELAHVSSGVMAKEDSLNRVLYFDLRKHERGGLEPTSVSSFNALFELLQFSLLFENRRAHDTIWLTYASSRGLETPARENYLLFFSFVCCVCLLCACRYTICVEVLEPGEEGRKGK